MKVTARVGYTEFFAGISKKAFNEATVSDQPFYCHYCRCNLQEEEISLLKSTIVELKAELKEALKKTNSQKEEFHSTQATCASITDPTSSSSTSAPSRTNTSKLSSNNPNKSSTSSRS